MEALVAREFLERARYYLLQGDSGSFIAERQWELADDQERRMLLEAVIDRVVILPLEPTQEHPGRAGRRIAIEWKEAPTRVEPPPTPKGVKATGRGVAFRREQVEQARREREAAIVGRSRRSRAARADWRSFREERLIDAGIPAAVGR